MNWPLIASCVLFTSTAFASEAAFSADGKTVHICPRDGAKVWSVTLAGGKTVVTDLAKELGGEETPIAITNGPKGVLWLASQHAVWHWNPAEGKIEKKAKIPGDTIEDIAWNPVSDTLFIAGRLGENNPSDQFVALRPGEKEAVEVKLPLGMMIAPVFDAKGRFFFRHDDDLWVGGENPHSDDVEMSAYRLAPLAHVLTENNEVRGSKIVSGIAPGEKTLYVGLSSMVEGSVVKLPKPTKAPAGDPLEGHPAELKGAWKRMAAMLQSAEEISFPDHVSSVSALCASADSARVFFFLHYENGNKKFVVIEGKTGKMRVVGDAPGKE